MKIKELQKTVNVAWSPQQQYPIYLAAGSAAQQLDSNGNSVLEIYSTNLKDPGYDLELKASLPSQYSFQKLIWSPTGYNGNHPNGLIVGGCESGHLMIYSPAKMIAGEEGLIARQDSHTGPVRGLDFNPFQTNLLASVASESEIFVWDLNNTATHMTPGTKTQPLEDVQNVAWNRQVQHILASVFSSRCVIWDLRKNEQIIKLSDTQSRVRWRAVQWHPEVATQIWLASEEDQAPVVQMWDLRYATAPAKTVQIHQRGILGMSWCPKDSDIMVSCGKDNKIYCWNPNTTNPEGEILSEIASTSQWYSDVQWCPRNPALIASSSLDGNVSLYSLFGGTQQQVQTSNKIADSFPGMDQFAQPPVPPQITQVIYSDPTKPPKWMKKLSGAKFGFGGKLVSFNSQSKSVKIYQVTTEPELVERASVLEKLLADATFSEYCRDKADQMSDQDGRYLWYFLKANFEVDPKEEMLNLLGYNKEDIDSKFSKYVQTEEKPNAVDQITDRISTLTHQTGDQNQIFDAIAAGSKQEDGVKSNLYKIPSGDDPDSLVTEALITGNIEAAVELCLESGRSAEALVIASTGGIELLSKTQDRYLKKQDSELSNVISALVTRDWMDFVSHCTLDSWKESLVAALKHSDRKLADICEKIGDRLLAEKSSLQYTKNAILCFICAGNVEKVLEAWYQLKSLEKNDNEYELSTMEIQELAEVIMLLSKSLEKQGIAVEPEGKFADFVSQYGGLLIAQGALNTAMAYIFALGPSTHQELDDLRDRLYNLLNQNEDHSQGRTLDLARLPQQQQQQHQPVQQNQSENLYNNQNISAFQQTGSLPSQGFVANPLVNQWNSPPPPAPTATHMPPPVAMFSPQPSSNLNTALAQSVPPPLTKPPVASQVNESLMHPPRPSSVSSQGSTTLPSRAKYLLDPSVSSGPQFGGQQNYGGAYNPPPTIPPTNFNTMPFNSNPTPYQQQSTMQPLSTSSIPTIPAMQNNYMPINPMQPNNYLPGIAPIESAPPTARSLSSVQRNPTPPPGWNDPPVLKSNRQQIYSEQNKMSAKHAGTRRWQKIINHSSGDGNKPYQSNQGKKSETSASAITHPIFGVDPNQNQNGFLDPNAQYQNQSLPPLPNTIQQQYPPQVPFNQNQQNNNQNNPLPGQMNFQTSAIHSSMYQQQHTGYQEQPAPTQQRKPEPPKEKPPLPEEFIYLQTVFEELKTQCLAASSDPRTKRKFADVSKRLENLYDCLRDGRLTPNTITALNQIVQYIQIADYGNALTTHTSIAFGTDFAQTASFMPGIKVLIQSAADLKVYLR